MIADRIRTSLAGRTEILAPEACSGGGRASVLPARQGNSIDFDEATMVKLGDRHHGPGWPRMRQKSGICRVEPRPVLYAHDVGRHAYKIAGVGASSGEYLPKVADDQPNLVLKTGIWLWCTV